MQGRDEPRQPSETAEGPRSGEDLRQLAEHARRMRSLMRYVPKRYDPAIIEALALLFGRDRLVRRLTEHDFHGSAPDERARILCIATVTGFTPHDPHHHSSWFSPEPRRSRNHTSKPASERRRQEKSYQPP